MFKTQNLKFRTLGRMSCFLLAKCHSCPLCDSNDGIILPLKGGMPLRLCLGVWLNESEVRQVEMLSFLL